MHNDSPTRLVRDYQLSLRGTRKSPQLNPAGDNPFGTLRTDFPGQQLPAAQMTLPRQGELSTDVYASMRWYLDPTGATNGQGVCFVGRET